MFHFRRFPVLMDTVFTIDPIVDYEAFYRAFPEERKAREEA